MFGRIFNENMTVVHLLHTLLKLDKPIYVGMAILDLSKTLMYDFHYNYMKPKYGDNLKLLFTDTDSLCYHVFTPDIYQVNSLYISSTTIVGSFANAFVLIIIYIVLRGFYIVFRSSYFVLCYISVFGYCLMF